MSILHMVDMQLIALLTLSIHLCVYYALCWVSVVVTANNLPCSWAL